MKSVLMNNKGFSLIEILASLLIAIILAIFIGLSVINMAESFIFVRTNTETFQKGQIALARMVKEFNNIQSVTAGSSTSISFSSYRDASAHSVTLSGANILLDDAILTDDVNSFTLSYYDNYNTAAQSTWAPTRKIIEINLVLNGADNTTSTFNARIAPSFI